MVGCHFWCRTSETPPVPSEHVIISLQGLGNSQRPVTHQQQAWPMDSKGYLGPCGGPRKVSEVKRKEQFKLACPEVGCRAVFKLGSSGPSFNVPHAMSQHQKIAHGRTCFLQPTGGSDRPSSHCLRRLQAGLQKFFLFHSAGFLLKNFLSLLKMK